MTFTIQQLLEKSHEHRAKICLLFIDLQKAYDSVSLAAMWRALQKLCIPENTIALIQSFHEGMRAQIRVSGKLLEDTEVDNALQQGCSLGLTLFNLYVCLVAERWREQIAGRAGVGTLWKYKLDGKLFR